MEGLGASLRSLLASAADMGRTRLDLACVELEEERLRLTRLLLIATATLFFAAMGLVLASLLVVLMAGERHRLLALALLSACHLSTGLALALAWRRERRRKPALLEATRRALRADVRALLAREPRP